MPRYTSYQNVKDWLLGYSLSWTEYTDAKVSFFIDRAEADVDRFCNRIFGLRKFMQIMNGEGTSSLVLQHYPLVMLKRLAVMYYPLQVIREFTDGDGYLIIDREAACIAIRPSFALQGAFPPDYANYYAYLFPPGDNNITAEFYAGHVMMADNLGFDQIANLNYNDVMTVTTDLTKVYLNLPFSIGNTGFKVYKDVSLTNLTLDAATWTMESPNQLSSPIASYAPASIYRMVYIPMMVEGASTMLAAANILNSIGGRDDSIGGGGVQSASIGGFSESYGNLGKYGAQIGEWKKSAFESLAPFKVGAITFGR